MPGGKLIVVCGLPGAGKTTHARRLEAELPAVRLCPDEWIASLGVSLWDEPFRARLEALQWTLGRRLLALGLTVVVEWGTWAREERDLLREGARSLGAGAELHLLSAPEDVLFDRIQRRGMEDPPIAREDLRRWIALFQTPTPEERASFDRVLDLSATHGPMCG